MAPSTPAEPSTSHDLRRRFLALGERLGCGAQVEAHWTALAESYGESHRAYHTLQHIGECLTAFDQLRLHADDSDLVEFALWAHDIVYKPSRSDNEQRSAEWGASALRAAGATPARIDQLSALILSTTHAAPPQSKDAGVVCDADLWVLGAPESRFDEYELQVREEFAWVPMPIFRARRIEILERFLARATIYQTPTAIQTLEERARSNLHRSLTALRAPGSPG